MRIVADLRVMHSKVDEFYRTVRALQVNHSEADVYTYADPPRFNDDIKKVMDIYVWFEKLKGDALGAQAQRKSLSLL